MFGTKKRKLPDCESGLASADNGDWKLVAIKLLENSPEAATSEGLASPRAVGKQCQRSGNFQRLVTCRAGSQEIPDAMCFGYETICQGTRRLRAHRNSIQCAGAGHRATRVFECSGWREFPGCRLRV